MENTPNDTTLYPALFSAPALCKYHSRHPRVILTIFTTPSELPRQALLLFHPGSQHQALGCNRICRLHLFHR